MSPKAILAGLAAATTVVSGVMAARSYKQAAATEQAVGQTNQQLAERDAKIKDQQARELARLSDLQALDDEQDFEQLQAQTELAYANNNIMLSGTAAHILAFNASEFEEQQALNDLAARTQEDAVREQAVQDRMRGQLELTISQQRASSLRTQAGTALLGSVTRAASIPFGRSS